MNKAARAFNGLARELGNAMQRYMVKEQGLPPVDRIGSPEAPYWFYY